MATIGDEGDDVVAPNAKRERRRGPGRPGGPRHHQSICDHLQALEATSSKLKPPPEIVSTRDYRKWKTVNTFRPRVEDLNRLVAWLNENHPARAGDWMGFFNGDAGDIRTYFLGRGGVRRLSQDPLARQKIAAVSGTYQVIWPDIVDSNHFVLEVMRIELNESEDIAKLLMLTHTADKSNWLYVGDLTVSTLYLFSQLERPHGDYQGDKAIRSMSLFAMHESAAAGFMPRYLLSGLMLRGQTRTSGFTAPMATPILAFREAGALPSVVPPRLDSAHPIASANVEASRVFADEPLIVGRVSKASERVFSICEYVFNSLWQDMVAEKTLLADEGRPDSRRTSAKRARDVPRSGPMADVATDAGTAGRIVRKVHHLQAIAPTKLNEKIGGDGKGIGDLYSRWRLAIDEDFPSGLRT